MTRNLKRLTLGLERLLLRLKGRRGCVSLGLKGQPRGRRDIHAV